MTGPGRRWGRPETGEAELTVTGDDRALAAAVATHTDPLVRFQPRGSDLARTVGLGTRQGVAVPMDVIATSCGLAVNVVVVGTAPDATRRASRRRPLRVLVEGRVWFVGRATGLVVANGQFLRGADLAPRGHPGDGRLEVQVYAPAPGQRRGLRARLATGAHLPHPDIHTTAARRVEVVVPRELPVALDGHRVGRAAALTLEVEPAAYRLLL